MARYMEKIPKQNRPFVYPTLRKRISEIMPGMQLPEAWDDATMEPVLTQVKFNTTKYFSDETSAKIGDIPAGLRQFEGMAELAGLIPGTPEFQQAAKIHLGQEARARNQLYDSADGANVISMGGGNSPTAAPVMAGGAPQATAPAGQSPAPRGAMSLTDLEPMVSGFGGKVSSTFRTPAHNAEVGGKPNSQHLTGNAMDVVFPNANAKRMAIDAARKNGYQAIDEGDHVHFQLARGGQQGGTQLRPAPKAENAGSLQERLDLAKSMGATDQELKAIVLGSSAPKPMSELQEYKNEQVNKDKQNRYGAATSSIDETLSRIDELEQHPGFNDLGSAYGDAMSNIPFIRTEAKGAEAKLEAIRGQIALATMAELKTLSSSGATGFGALSEKELALLKGSIDNLTSSVSLTDLKSNLANVKKRLKAMKDGIGKEAKAPASQAPANDDQALLDKYLK